MFPPFLSAPEISHHNNLKKDVFIDLSNLIFRSETSRPSWKHNARNQWLPRLARLSRYKKGTPRFLPSFPRANVWHGRARPQSLPRISAWQKKILTRDVRLLLRASSTILSATSFPAYCNLPSLPNRRACGGGGSGGDEAREGSS